MPADDFPTFEPLHPAFTGSAQVLSSTAHGAKDLDGPRFAVNLTENTCTCQNGKPFEWHQKNGGWVPYQYCSHKLRAIADIVDRNDRPSDQVFAYMKALASRYNKYEVVSAFHKELRRGSVDHAIFWGSVLMTTRGAKGVLKYLLNILYEEGRDHRLGEWLLDQNIAKAYDLANVCKAIELFCASPKKWQLMHRWKYLEAEMLGYEKLVIRYGRDVAKAGDIIAVNQRDALMNFLIKGVRETDLVTAQYGLKGLQKSKTGDIDTHRAWIANSITGKCDAILKKRPAYKRVEAFVGRRAGNGFGIGYHELNALVDAALGEPYNAGCTPEADFAAMLAKPAPKLRLAVAPVIPLYSQDNHTWAGKALIRRFPDEWQAGANQVNYDLRWCGAYIGVVYRHLAIRQFGDVNVPWSSVVWPKGIHSIVANLWY